MEKANQTPLLKCVEYLENLKRMATKPPEKYGFVSTFTYIFKPIYQNSSKHPGEPERDESEVQGEIFPEAPITSTGEKEVAINIRIITYLRFNVFSQSQSVCEFKMCSEQGKRSLSPSIFTKRGGSHEKHKIHRGRPSANLPPNIKHQEAPGITHQITPKEQISMYIYIYIYIYIDEGNNIGGISKGLENYLEFVSFSYYGGSARPKENEGLGKQRRNLHFTTLDRLVSPLRKDLVFGNYNT